MKPNTYVASIFVVVTCTYLLVTVHPAMSEDSTVDSLVPIGSRVRLSVDYSPEERQTLLGQAAQFVGTLSKIENDTVAILLGEKTVRFDLVSVSKFEIHDGTRSTIIENAAPGLILGIGAGLLYGVANCSEAEADSEVGFLKGLGGNGKRLRESMIVGASLGLVVGIITGLSSSKDKWKVIDKNKLTIGFTPVQENSLALKMSLTF